MKELNIFFGNPLHLLEFNLSDFNLIITAHSWSIHDPQVPLLMVEKESKDIKLYYNDTEKKLNTPEKLKFPSISFGVLSNSSIFKYEDYLYITYNGIKLLIFVENLMQDEEESKNLIYKINWSISKLLDVYSLIVFIKPNYDVTFSLIDPNQDFHSSLKIKEFSTGIVKLKIKDEIPIHVKDPMLDVLLEKIERDREKTLKRKRL